MLKPPRGDRTASLRSYSGLNAFGAAPENDRRVCPFSPDRYHAHVAAVPQAGWLRVSASSTGDTPKFVWPASDAVESATTGMSFNGKLRRPLKRLELRRCVAGQRLELSGQPSAQFCWTTGIARHSSPQPSGPHRNETANVCALRR